jgi:hypothetical protein
VIRAPDKKDLQVIMSIQDTFYRELVPIDFTKKFDALFIVDDDRSGDIITVGGIRPLAEVVTRTNKHFSVRQRKNALFELLAALIYVANELKYDQLHAFSHDETWIKHLKKVGFYSLVENKTLVLDLEHEQKTGTTSRSSAT